MRKIIHIDMDCFYASIEIRDNQSLKNKPVAVGYTADEQGVLATCNYTARDYGLHSAMPTALAFKLCPNLILLPLNMPKYQLVSHEFHQILLSYTDLIEPIALDEAYLDVSQSNICNRSATLIAKKIVRDIFNKLSLTASAGVASNKFLAKIASNVNKPNGIYVINPEDSERISQEIPVRMLPGVGGITERKLRYFGVNKCKDILQYDYCFLLNNFGKLGGKLYQYARGMDDTPVEGNRSKKSISVESTFLNNIDGIDECINNVNILVDKLESKISKNHLPIKKQFLKVKFHDYSKRQIETNVALFSREAFLTMTERLMYGNSKKIRLLGVGVKLGPKELQKDLFSENYE